MTFPRALAALGLLALVWFGGCQYAKTRQERALYQRSADSLVNTLTELRHREFIRDQQDKAREDSLRVLAAQTAQQRAQIARQDTANQILARSYADAKREALSDPALSPTVLTAFAKADSLIAGLEGLRDSLNVLVNTQALQIATLGRQVTDLQQSRLDLQQTLDRTVAMWHRAEALSQCRINLGLFALNCPSRGAVAVVTFTVGAVLGRLL